MNNNGTPAAMVQVGKLLLQPEHFIAEGGFARVYLARLNGAPVALKVINTSADLSSYGPVMQELEIMKQLDHRSIVSYLDSQVSRRSDGSHLVYLAMEYCTGGGLLDFMNRAKQLKEQQIWLVLKDVVEGVAYMHSKGIVNRDVKVENVLLSLDSVSYGVTYKICDFGSCTTVQYAPGYVLSQSQMSMLQEELERMTTLSYRAPEMCDLYKVRRVGLTAKTDVWAIGVLLYKMCYYDVPFAEADGKLAILNSRYTIPSQPQYSERLINIISRCITDSALKRPTAYQLNVECCNVLQIPNTLPEYHSQYDVLPVDKDLPQTPVVQQPTFKEPSIVPNARRGRVLNGHSASNSVSGSLLGAFEGFAAQPSSLQDVFGAPVQQQFAASPAATSNFDDVFGQADPFTSQPQPNIPQVQALPRAQSRDIYPSEVIMPEDQPQQHSIQPHQDLVGLFHQPLVQAQNYQVQSTGGNYTQKFSLCQSSYSSQGANYYTSSYSSQTTSVFSQAYQSPKKQDAQLFKDLSPNK